MVVFELLAHLCPIIEVRLLLSERVTHILERPELVHLPFSQQTGPLFFQLTVLLEQVLSDLVGDLGRVHFF